MKHYEYVSKNVARPYREEFEQIISELQNRLRSEFTLKKRFIGSSSRNMITFDPKTNKGFDFDVNLEMNETSDEYEPDDIYRMIFGALQSIASKKGFKVVQGTRVITLKKVNMVKSKIEYSCDIAIVYNYEEDGYCGQQYIRFNKKHGSYAWTDQPSPFLLEDMVDEIRQNDMWNKVRKLYLYKKNTNMDSHKKSRLLYAEAVKEIYDLI